MNLILLFAITFVLQVVVISAKLNRTPALWKECTSTFETNFTRSHHNTDGDCTQGWKELNITNGSIQHHPSVNRCRYYIQKSLSKCKGAESSGAHGCVYRHTWRAYLAPSCFDSWISLRLSFRPNGINNSSPCFRFHRTTKHITTEMTSRCPAANNTTAAWSEWKPIATECDVTCKRQWRRQCMIGLKVVRVERCGDGDELEWRSCDDCKITPRSRRDSNISDTIVVMPRSRYNVPPPVQEQKESMDTPQLRYFSYWPGFATGFACCIVLVVMVIVGLKIVKCHRERRKNRRRNELRLYYAKPNHAWQMKLAHPAQTSVKSRTQGHVDPKVAGARYAEDGDVSTNPDLYPTVCHHDSGYQADDETNEKARIVPTTSPKTQTPHELLTSAPHKVMMSNCRDVMASYDICDSAEGNSQQHGSSNRSSPFISFLKIHGDDGDDGDSNDLPLVPYSYRLRLTAKQRAPATQACYQPGDLINDKSTTGEVKKYGTDMSST